MVPTDNKASILKKFRRFSGRYLYIIVLAVYSLVIVHYWGEIIRLITLHPFAVLYAIFLSLLAIAAQSFNFVDLLNARKKIRFLPTYRIWALSNLLNYIAPFQPGLIARSIFFKSHKIGYLQFALGTLRQMQLSLWAGTGLLAIFFPTDLPGSGIVIPGAILAFTAWLIFMFSVCRKSSVNWLPFNKSGHSEYLLRLPTIQQFMLIIVQYFLIAASYYLVLYELGIDISVNTSFLIAIGLVFATIISITPNNIGLQELIIGAVVYNITTTEAYTVVVPIIFRLSHIVSCGIILSLLSMSMKPD